MCVHQYSYEVNFDIAHSTDIHETSRSHLAKAQNNLIVIMSINMFIRENITSWCVSDVRVWKGGGGGGGQSSAQKPS